MAGDDYTRRQGYGRQLSLSDYALIAWRRKWLVLAISLLAAAIGFFSSYVQDPVFEASAYLMYIPDSTAALVGAGSLNSTETRVTELENVGTVISSPIIGDRVVSTLKWGKTSPWFTIGAEISTDLGSSDSSTSNVIAVTAQARTGELAAELANTYAKEFVDWRLQSQREEIEKAQEIVSEQLDSYDTPASRLSADYAALKDRLQTLNVMYGTVSGGFRVIQPATVPKAPASPRPMRSAMAGFALGLLAGLGLAFLLEQVDRRVRDAQEAAEILGLRIIGRIPRVSPESMKGGALYVLNNPLGDGADAMRVLRTNLDFLVLEPPVKVISVVSPGKGDGKTVTVSNLAVAAALSGKRVVVIDADLRKPGVHSAFSLPNATGLTDVIRGRLAVSDALQTVALSRKYANVRTAAGDVRTQAPDRTGQDSELRVLTSGALPPNPGEVVGSRRFGELLDDIDALGADYVFVDSPGLLGDAAAIAAHMDAVFFVVNADEAKRSNLEQAREAIEPLPCSKLGMVGISRAFRSTSAAEYVRS